MKQELFNNKTKAEDYQRQPKQLGLYEASHEHDACGVGMLVNIQGGKSHELVESALKVLENMRHRGAEGADNKTGDGAGIMLQIPHEFILLQGIPVPEKGKYGTGLLFLPKDGKDQAVILSVIIEEIEKDGLTLMHLRNVPTCPEILGEAALANEPDIKQIFITGFTESETADRKLYIIRKRIENRIRKSDIPTREDFYIVSLSTKNIVYKGMLSSLQLRNYFPDLTNSYFTSGLALVTPVSAPTLSPPGDWHNLSACWHTTAKSIPSAATAAGWKPVRVYSPLPPWETSGRYAPSCNRA